MAKKIWLSSILLLVILSASFYFVFNDEVRIDITKTRSIFKVQEDGGWVISGIEYVNLFDGTTKMRAKNRSLEIIVGENNITRVTRIANYKDGIYTIEIYIFDPTDSNIESFPVSHSIQVINGEGKRLQYEVQKLLYDGETVWNVESPQSFGRKMKVEWEEGNYYSRIYKYKNRDEGKLTVKYRINSDDYSKNIRLFDPEGDYIDSFDLDGDNVNNPGGITSYSDYLWIVDTSDDTINKFWKNGTFISAVDVGTDTANDDPSGVTTNGTYIWVIDQIDDSWYKYHMNLTYIEVFDFGAITSNDNPYGIAFSEEGAIDYLYITDTGDDEIYVYDVSGTPITNFDTGTHGSVDPRGITSNGTYIWVMDDDDEEAYKFHINGTYISKWATDALNGNALGISQNNTYFWVTDYGDDEVYKYEMNVTVPPEADTIAPGIEFVSPTPGTGSQSNTDIYINVSSTDALNNISTFINFDNTIIGWWRMDDVDGSGNPVDYFGNYNGTKINDAVKTETGKIGDAFRFDGTGDYINISSAAQFQNGNLSVSSWFNVEDMSNDKINIIWRIGDASSTSDINLFIADDSGTDYMRYEVYNGTTHLEATLIDTVPTNEWHHLAGTFDGDMVSLYYDGELVHNVTMVGSRGEIFSSFISIGGDTLDGNYFNGQIDDVIVFNRSLNATEITGIYANQITKHVEVNFSGLAERSYTYTAYSQDTSANVNLTETRTRTIAADSCTYTSGDWEIDCNDNCTISSNVAMGGNDLVFSNTGTFHMSANISNYGNLNLSSGCNIVFDDNTFLIS